MLPAVISTPFQKEEAKKSVAGGWVATELAVDFNSTTSHFHSLTQIGKAHKLKKVLLKQKRGKNSCGDQGQLIYSTRFLMKLSLLSGMSVGKKRQVR